MRTLPKCLTLDSRPEFLDRSSETQYKCFLGDPFEKVGGAGTVGVGGAGFRRGYPANYYAHSKPHRQDAVGLTDQTELVFFSVQFLSN